MEEIDLMELFKMFWRKKNIIIGVTIVFIVLGIVYTTQFVKPVYTSSTTLVLATSNKSNNIEKEEDAISTTDITINSKLVSTYRELVKSDNILGKVKKNLNIDISESELKEKISVSSVKDAELIQISVTDEDNTFSEKVANEIAKVFIDYINTIYKRENIYIVDNAKLETEPSNINHGRDIVVFAIIGVIVSMLYVFTRNILDTTIKSVEEIETLYKIPVLASMPIYEDTLKKSKRRTKLFSKIDIISERNGSEK